MDCDDLIRYLSDYLDDELDDDLVDQARRHLSTCHNCRVVLDSTRRTILLYREHGQQQAIPAERHARLFETLAAALTTRPDSQPGE